MIEKKEHLANLSRLEFSDEELVGFQKDLDSILAYVEQVKEVGAEGESKPDVGVVHNVMRDDVEPHADGEHKKEIVDAFPDEEDGYLKVKKILS